MTPREAAQSLSVRKSEWKNREALATSGAAQTLVQADERLPGRSILAPDERCRELKRIRRPQRVDGEQESGAYAHIRHRSDDVDAIEQASQSIECLLQQWLGKPAFAVPSMEG